MIIIILVSIFFTYIIIYGIIRYLKYSTIPKNFIKTKSIVEYYEERAKWTSNSIDLESGGEISPIYYKPIITYEYKNQKIIYEPKIPIRLKSANFDINFEIFFDPNNPKNARHRTI